MFCTKCGKELDDDALFCDNCGAKVEDIEEAVEPKIKQPKAYKEQNRNVCPVCGANLEDDCDFCTECGNRLKKDFNKTEPKPIRNETPPKTKETWINSLIEFIKDYIKNPYKTNQGTYKTNSLITVFALVTYLSTATIVSHKIANVFWDHSVYGALQYLIYLFGFVYGVFAILLPFCITLVLSKINKVEVKSIDCLISVIQSTILLSIGNIICIFLGCISYSLWEIGLLLCLSIYISSTFRIIKSTIRTEEDIFKWLNIFGAVLTWMIIMFVIIIIEKTVIENNIGYENFMYYFSYLA